MTPDYRAGISEADLKVYDETVSVLDELFHASIEFHKEPDCTCPSVAKCHSNMIDSFMEDLAEHLADPVQIEAAKMQGFDTPIKMLEEIWTHHALTMKQHLMRCAAILRLKKQAEKVS